MKSLDKKSRHQVGSHLNFTRDNVSIPYVQVLIVRANSRGFHADYNKNIRSQITSSGTEATKERDY